MKRIRFSCLLCGMIITMFPSYITSKDILVIEQQPPKPLVGILPSTTVQVKVKKTMQETIAEILFNRGIEQSLAKEIANSTVEVSNTLKTYSIAVEPYEILGFIAVESNFNPYAKSEVNAKGLMQVTKPCVDEVKKTVNISNSNPFNIHTNILIGSFYYGMNKSKLGAEKSIVAYNQGFNNLNQSVEYSRGMQDSYLNKIIMQQQEFKEELENANSN